MSILCFRSVTFAVFHFPVAGFVLEYPTGAPQINVPARTAPSLAPIRRGHAHRPISGCHSSSLASILIHKFSPCLHLAAPGELCDHVLSGMLHSLSGLPVQISRGGDRLRFSSLDILFLLLAQGSILAAPRTANGLFLRAHSVRTCTVTGTTRTPPHIPWSALHLRWA